MSEHPARRGIHTPMFEQVVREVHGRPVVVWHRPWTALDVHRHWRRFGGWAEADHG